jgi:hypothetical protein
MNDEERPEPSLMRTGQREGLENNKISQRLYTQRHMAAGMFRMMRLYRSEDPPVAYLLYPVIRAMQIDPPASYLLKKATYLRSGDPSASYLSNVASRSSINDRQSRSDDPPVSYLLSAYHYSALPEHRR